MGSPVGFVPMGSPDRVRVGGLSGHDSTPFRLAKSAGFYEREGLDVEWVDLNNRGPNELENDRLDLCICSLEGALYHILQPQSNLVLAGTYIASKRTKGIYSTKADDEAFSDRRAVFPVTGEGGSGHILVSMKAKDLGLEHSPNIQECGSAGAVLAAMENAAASINEPCVVVWDKYAAQPYVNEGKWHAIGEIMTPWSASVFTAHRRVMQPERWKVIEKFFEVSRRAIIEMCSSPAPAIDHVCQQYGLSECDAKHWMLSSLFSCQPVTSTEDLRACATQLQQLDHWKVTDMVSQICADGCREVQTGAEVAALAHFDTWHDSAMKLFTMAPSSRTSTVSVAKNQKPEPMLDLMSTTVGDEDLMSVETQTVVPPPSQNGEVLQTTSSVVSSLKVRLTLDSKAMTLCDDTADAASINSRIPIDDDGSTQGNDDLHFFQRSSYNKASRPCAKSSSLSSPYLRQDAHDSAVKLEEGSFVLNPARTVFSKNRTQRLSAAVIDHHFGPKGAAIHLEGNFSSNHARSSYSMEPEQRMSKVTDHHFGPEVVEEPLDGDFCSNPRRSAFSQGDPVRSKINVTDHHFGPEKAQHSLGVDCCSSSCKSGYSRGDVVAWSQRQATDHHFGSQVAEVSDSGDFCSNSQVSVYSMGHEAKPRTKITDLFGNEETENSLSKDLCSNSQRSAHTKHDAARSQMDVVDHHFGPERHFQPGWAADLLGGVICQNADTTLDLLFDTW